MINIFKKKQEQEPKQSKEIKQIVTKYKNQNKQYNAKEMLKLYNVAKPKNMFDVKGHVNKFRNKYNPLSVFLINMELSNGKFMQFVIKPKDNGFKFDEGFYIIDENLKYYNETSKLWALDYHEELSFPINKRTDVKYLKDAISEIDEIGLKSAINPISLDKFMQSTVIQKLLMGAEMDATLRFLKMGIILIGLGVLICVIILASLVL